MRSFLAVFADRFLLILIGTVALASVLPPRGAAVGLFQIVTDLAIVLLFFLHGAKLSRDAIRAGIWNWRLHATVLVSTFVLFPALGLALGAIGRGWVDPAMLAGVAFLSFLPSTVQSSIAFTSIAGGNVPAAVCSASVSNLAGIVIAPILVHIFLGGRGDGISFHSIEAIVLQLLVPFVAGHLSRPLIAGLIERHRRLVNIVDRGSILLVVYTAFGAAVVEGLWRTLSARDLATILVLDAVLLGLVLTATTFGARLLGFSREDEIAIVFCGSKKSLASGVPMAGVLFPAAGVGPMIVPLMLFHQIQLMVCAVLARRYAASARHARAEPVADATG